MKTILVTGGLGTIGRRMVPILRARGYDAKVLDSRIQREPDYIRADVCSMVEVMEAFKRWEIDTVLHLAGEVGRENGELFARRAVDINVSGTINMIQVCREFGSRLIFASTSEVYGDCGSRVMHEEMPLGQPTNCYAISKLQAEQYIKHFVENYDLQANIVRIFMCYGPGEYPSYFRSAIARFTYNILHDRPIVVHRNAERSWCYVDDIVEGWIRVMEHFRPGRTEVYNIGRNDPKSMEQVARLICALAGKDDGLVRFEDVPKFVTPVKNASFEKAKRELGFEATVTLEEGLRETIRWQRENVTDPHISC